VLHHTVVVKRLLMFFRLVIPQEILEIGNELVVYFRQEYIGGSKAPADELE